MGAGGIAPPLRMLSKGRLRGGGGIEPNCLKNPRVRKIFVRNSGAGNGYVNFYGRLEKCVRSAGKAMSIKFLVLGGGGVWVFWGGGEVPILFFIGNENSARSFSDRSSFEPPWGHGRPRLRVMDVRTEMLVFPGFRGPDRSFCPRTSAGISAWTSAGYPAPKLTSLG